MEFNYRRLQFRHSVNTFENRAAALDHFSDIVNTEMTASTVFGDSMYAEPLVAKYKDAGGREQVILAIGTDSGHSAYHLIDTANIYELIETNSGNILTVSGELVTAIERLDNVDTDIEDQIKKNEVKIEKTEPSAENVLEEYVLTNNEGIVLGEHIKVYKESALIGAVEGHKGAVSVEQLEDGSFKLTYDTDIEDVEVEYLYMVYRGETGELEMVGINLNDFLREHEAGNGITIVDHKMAIRIKEGEEFLSVDENGLCTVGIRDAIFNAVNAEGQREAAAEAYISGAVTTEIERAVKAEEGLQQQITDNIAKIKSVSPSDSTVREEFVLVNAKDEEMGEHIRIYKDSTLVGAVMGFKGVETITYEKDAFVLHYDEARRDESVEYLYIVYKDASGDLQFVPVELENYLNENEFKNGLQVVNHEVSVKVTNGDAYLAVDETGVHTIGIKEAINAAVSAEAERATAAEEALKAAVEAEEERATQREDKLEEKINANEVKIESVAPSSANVLEEYVLTNANNEELGEHIKIYKDRAFVRMQLGHEGGSDIQVIEDVPTVVYNHPNVNPDVEYLYVIYKDENGAYQFDGISLDGFINKDEMGDGLKMAGSNITLKIKNGDSFIAVDGDGLQTVGIQEVIDSAVKVETDRAMAAENVLTEAIKAETDRATAAESALSETIKNLATVVDEETVKIEEITPSEANVLNEYVLKNKVGDILGDHIKVPKQAAIVDIQIGDKGGVSVERLEDGKYRINYGDEHDPNVEYLYFIYKNEDDTLNLAGLDLEKFIVESEFGDGMVIIDHKACVKIKDGDRYIAVDAEGVHTIGIDEAIEAKCGEISSALTEAIENENLRAVAAEEFISGAVTSEIERATNAEEGLQQQITDNIVTVERIASSSANVRDEYAVKNAKGETLGETIKIYKDSAFVRMQLGHKGGSGVEEVEGVPTVVYNHPDVDESVEYLYIIYKDGDGNYQFTGTDIDKFINSDEIGNGLQMNGTDIEVKVKADDDFMTVDADGVHTVGIQEAIDTAVETEKTRAEEAEANLQEAIDTLRTEMEDGTTKIEKITPTKASTLNEYVLKSAKGDELGDHIIVPKQAAIVDIQIGDKGGSTVEETEEGKYKITYGPDHDPAVEYLYFVYKDGEGKLNFAGIDFGKFISEGDLGNGIDVMNHVASIKVKKGEKYLMVNADGVQTVGIDEAIANATGTLNQAVTEKIDDEIARSTAADEYISGVTSAFSASVVSELNQLSDEVTYQVGQVNAAVTANSDKINAEITRATEAEVSIRAEALAAVEAEKTRATGAEDTLNKAITANKISSKDVVLTESETGTVLTIQTDENTITKKAIAGDIYDTNAAVLGSLLTIKSVTGETETNYQLQGADGVQIGDAVRVPITKYQNGISVVDNVVSLKVGPYNEFLAVNADSISVSGVTKAINDAKVALEASLSAEAGERDRVDKEIKASITDTKNEITTQMGTDKTELTGKITIISGNLNTHVSEFNAFETNITEKLNSEIDRAEAEENRINQAVLDEAQRAKAKENSIAADVAKNRILPHPDFNLSVTETGTTIELKTDEKTVTKHAGDGNSLGTLLTVTEVVPTATNISKAYQLQDGTGAAIGTTIEIPTEGSLIDVRPGRIGDTIDPNTGAYIGQPGEGSGNETINFVYRLANGSYTLAQIEISKYFTDAHFGAGLSNQDGVISIMKGDGCEKYLVIGEHTISIIGVDAEIAKTLSSANAYTDEKVGAMTDRIAEAEADIEALSGKSHTHNNSTVLDGITTDRVTRWDNAETNAKAYTDKEIGTINDKIDDIEGEIVSLNGSAHNHSNLTVLDTIDATKVNQWDAAQPNVIESVSVNGTPLPVTAKSVNVDLSTYATTEYVDSKITEGLEGVDKAAIEALTNRIVTLETKVAALEKQFEGIASVIRSTMRDYLNGTDYQIKLTQDVDNNHLSIGFADNAIFGGNNSFGNGSF